MFLGVPLVEELVGAVLADLQGLPVLPEALSREGATLIDVMVPEDENVLPMVPGGRRLDDMILGGEEA